MTATRPRPSRLRDKFTTYGNCGHCGRPIRNHREYLTHGMAHSYWDSKAGKAMRRKMGDARDRLRRKSRAAQEHDGLVDGKGRRTPESRTRPVLPGRPGLKDLAGQERHHRDHRKARDLDGKADRANAKGRDERARRHQERADALRSRHGTPSRADQEAEARERDAADKAEADRKEREKAARPRKERTRPDSSRPEPSRPAPSRPEPASREKVRTAPARTEPRAPAPPGRLAPGARENGHHRPAPSRDDRTRTPR